MGAPTQKVSAAAVVAAIDRLSSLRFSREKATLFDYLCVKREQARATPGKTNDPIVFDSIMLSTAIDEAFGLLRGTPKPFLNPFGTRSGAIQWLAAGRARSGAYTNLTSSASVGNRILIQSIAPAPEGKKGKSFVFKPTAEKDLAGTLGKGVSEALKLESPKVPFEPLAAIALRRQDLPVGMGGPQLEQKFRDFFNLSSSQFETLFVSDPSFVLSYDDIGFTEDASTLPAHLRPSSTTAQQVVQATQSSSPSPNHALFPLSVDPAVLRRLKEALRYSKVVAVVGPPGTGKTSLVKQALDDAQETPSEYGFANPPYPLWRTAETGWTERDIIGGHFPTREGTLTFIEGIVLQSIRDNQVLVVDEMNRADLDRALGAAMTFLSLQEVDLSRSTLDRTGAPMVLTWDDGQPDSGRDDSDSNVVTYTAGRDWRMIGTYNDVDLGKVFHMSLGLARRMATVRVRPIAPDEFENVLVTGTEQLLPGTVATLKALYEQHLAIPLGPAVFIDIASFVIANREVTGPTEAALLLDGYLAYVSPHLRRLKKEDLNSFLDELEKQLPGSREELSWLL